MVEVKVGQKWKLFEDSEEGFYVKALSEDGMANISYENEPTEEYSWLLSEFNTAILLEDVEVRKFEAGQKVRVIDASNTSLYSGGEIGYIRSPFDGGYNVGFPDQNDWWWVESERLEAVEDDVVNDPQHYGGKDDPYEVIKVIEAWGLVDNAYLFNVVKYVARAQKKGNEKQDLEKARYYLDRYINTL